MQNVIIHNFDQINSTNIWAKENIKNFDKSKYHIIFANQQSNGQGSNNRTWLSPIGGIYCTICFHHINHNSNPNMITLVSAIAICNIFQKYNIKLDIKWPNDIICNQKKIGGILSELHTDWYIIGFGLNINLEINEINKISRPIFPASSLKIEGYNNLNCEHIKQDIITNFPEYINNWFTQGWDFFENKFKYHNLLLDKTIVISSLGNTYKGTFSGIGQDGQLEISTISNLESFYSGDILQLE
ncbi:Biotin/lipoate A/B protein ligase family [seawater metagenome]|uniref:Biotin/lipoate A/B protein ligase family n=1 Tax=seawater metagenome TaxID=1561972 RepID=A0A5E8CM40_9ZZZZ